jgi:hypothetical protein
MFFDSGAIRIVVVPGLIVFPNFCVTSSNIAVAFFTLGRIRDLLVGHIQNFLRITSRTSEYLS